ncbi:thioredoxin domain-containing protein [Thermodesulfovibrio sp.]|uniref:thioredoxin domain-containing protein n=1 Tax=Thermodesulfovibrio sp. TaxID=2067987 RepID=UPI003C798A9E
MIEWLPYEENSFKKAEIEDKPIFLHITAKWCNYCKKMKEECIDDYEIAEIINKNFIPVHIDRDERPDLDLFYQKASYIIGQGSGWPLNLFLTPEGKPFSGVNYSINEGKNHFKTMIEKVIDLYKMNKEKILQRSQTIVDAVKPTMVMPSEIRQELLQNPEEEIVKEIDFEFGGFKKTPKFPIYAHIDLLLWRYWIRPKPWIKSAIETTLKSMVSGGIYDHLEGGFHRYATDRAWLMPHFEKLAIDNAWHIINYLDAYNILKDPFYMDIAIEIVNYLKNNLFSPEGYFYSSQFADPFYYTWQEQELREISDMTITLVEGKAMIGERFVLIGRDRELIKQLKESFILKRKHRQSPETDKSIYCFVNGVCAEAFIKAWRIIKDKNLLNMALSAIDNTLRALFDENTLYRTKKIHALLDDYAYITSALISAYEVTSKDEYLNKATIITEMAINKLWDEEYGGFYDSEESIFSIRHKSIHDTPYPSANSIMIINLLKLHAIKRNEKYFDLVNMSLKAFSNLASPYLSPYYIKALLSYFDLLTLNFYTTVESNIGKATIHQITPFTVIAHRQKDGNYIIPSVGSKYFDQIYEPEELAKFLKL